MESPAYEFFPDVLIEKSRKHLVDAFLPALFFPW